MAIIPWEKFEGFDFGSRELSPVIDVYETETSITAEIRGFKGSLGSLDVSIRNGILVMKGEWGAEEEKKRKKLWKKKAVSGSFERVVQLPAGIDAASAEATAENGIVRIRIPKAKGKGKVDKNIPVREL